MITFNVSSYGATFGTGLNMATRTANKTALRNCCAAAEAAAAGGAEVEAVVNTTGSLEVYLDPATDILAPDAGVALPMLALLKPVGPMTVRGLGRTTRVVMFPDGPTFDYFGLCVDEVSGTRNVTIKDMAFIGPATFGPDDIFGNYNRHPIHHQGSSTPGHHARSLLTIDNVEVSGYYHGAIVSNSGDIDVAVTNSFLQAQTTVLGCFNQDGCDKTLLVQFCEGGHIYPGPDNHGAGIYVHPNISTNILDNDLYQAVRYCVYFNGNPEFPTPAYCNVLRNTISGGGSFLQSNAAITTVVTGNVSTVPYATAQIIALGPIEASGNTFTGGSSDCATGHFGDGAHSLQHYHHNTFIGLPGDGSPAGCVIGANIHVHDNTFALNSTTQSATSGAVSATGTEVIVEDNVLTGTFQALCGVYETHGPVTLRRNNVSGTGRAIYGIGGDGGSGNPLTLDLVLEDNVFGDNSILLLGFENNRVSGSGNALRPNFPVEFSFDLPSIQTLVNKAGTNPTPVASASLLDLHPSFNACSVSGAADIDDLLIAGDADQNAVFFGNYSLTFLSTARITADGNINPLSTEARSAGSTAYFVWDADTGKWDEYDLGDFVAQDTTLSFDDFEHIANAAGLGYVNAQNLKNFYDDVLARLSALDDEPSAVSGSRAANAALASLINALVAKGLITDSTTV
jgi:hypothetical protein